MHATHRSLDYNTNDILKIRILITSILELFNDLLAHPIINAIKEVVATLQASSKIRKLLGFTPKYTL